MRAFWQPLWKKLIGKRAKIAFAAVVVLTIATLVRAANPEILVSLRELTFDYFQRLAPRAYDPEMPVRIVDIDEASIAEYGQWPWPRTRLAELNQALADLGAASVSYDVIFSEPDRTSPAYFAKELASEDLAGDRQAAQLLQDTLGRLPDNDEKFARTLAETPSVIGFALVTKGGKRQPPAKSAFAYGGENPVNILPAHPDILPALPVLEEAASGIGSLSLSANDKQGVVRRVPLLVSNGINLYPSLAIETLRIAQGASGILVRSTGASGQMDTGTPAVTDLKVGAFAIPTNRMAELWAYFGHDRPERYVSAKDILDPAKREAARSQIDGQMVLVGSSATGLLDLRTTPLGEIVPGVSIHAQVLEQILSGDFLSRPDWANGAEILATLIVGCLVVLLFPALGATGSVLFGTLLSGLMIAGSYYAFRQNGLLLDPIYPSLSSFLVVATVTGVLYILTEREKRFVRQAFGQYLSPDLVSQLEASPDQLKLGGEMRDMTILFMDVRGFTPISEQLTPEELVAFLNTLLTPLSNTIQELGGTIDKYIGDSIMAFWNAPLPQEQHATLACRAGLAMLKEVDRLNERDGFAFKARGLKNQTVQIGIGLNTGDACVGNMGSDKRFNYSVIGDAVNIASRIESSCKAVGAELIVSEDTRRDAPTFAYLEAGEIPLKGKSQPVCLFALVGDEEHAKSAAFQELSDAHARLLTALKSNDRPEAEKALTECQTHAGTRLQPFYQVFAARLEAMPGTDHPA